eukprot:CAMPEP_0168591960 /NCGR_PEP_ID=MMETSP0420-20121227/7432_1 /TAXON_ID=498008 /ORGANISM="Pessonella sp." /LENGTH=148 /DNA_ID=CAMNT_0008627825 /DNA_START=135 /DNA_END=581 /DNA_ORIENTATION=+
MYGFSPKEVKKYRAAFAEFDVDGNGSADQHEVYVIMRKLGIAKSRQDVRALMAEIDTDGNGTIEFEEFLMMIKKIQAGEMKTESGFGAATKSFFGGGFFKKTFDVDHFNKEHQEREQKKHVLEAKYLSKTSRKKLDKRRQARERAVTK